MCVAGEKIVTICEKGDKLLEEEIAKVYRGKKISKGLNQLSSLLILMLIPLFRHFPPHHGFPVLFRHALYAPDLR